MNRDKCRVLGGTHAQGQKPGGLREDFERSEGGARCLEMAQQLYSIAARLQRRQYTHPGSDSSSDRSAEKCVRNQLVSLLMSLSLRLDADSLLREGREGEGTDTDTQALVMANLQQVSVTEKRAEGLLKQLEDMGSTCAPPELSNVFLMLSLAIRCRTASADVDTFVDQHQAAFLCLSAEELLRCADTARDGGPGCVGATRRMLQFGVQVLMRQATPAYALVGSLYRRLVYLSPSRLQVQFAPQL